MGGGFQAQNFWKLDSILSYEFGALAKTCIKNLRVFLDP